jgi:hypothetical protein
MIKTCLCIYIKQYFFECGVVAQCIENSLNNDSVRSVSSSILGFKITQEAFVKMLQVLPQTDIKSIAVWLPGLKASCWLSLGAYCKYDRKTGQSLQVENPLYL